MMKNWPKQKTEKTALIQHMTLSLVVLSFLSACNFSKVQRTQHESALPDTPSTAASSPEKDQYKEMSRSSLQDIYQKTISIKSETDSLQVLQVLKNNYLKNEIVDNPSQNNEPNIIAALSYYNTAMLQLLKLSPQSEATQKEIESYLQFTKESCSENLENCSRVKWIKKDPRAHAVLTQIAVLKNGKIPAHCTEKQNEKQIDKVCEADLRNLFQIISLSFATNNQIKDSELSLIFSSRAQQFATIFSKSKDPKDQEKLVQIGTLFDLIINNLNEKEDLQIILPIVKARPPWAFSHKEGQEFNYGLSKLFLVAAKNLMYEKNKLNAQLKEFILQDQKNTNNKTSILQMAQTLNKDPKTSPIFRNIHFNIQQFLTDDFYDEYFFIIDRLKNGHLNYDELEAFWNGTQKNITLFTQKIREIAQLELVNQVVKTNRYFSALLELNSLPSDQLFIKSIEDSRPLTEEWTQFFSQYSRISNLVGQIGSNSNAPAEDLKKMTDTKDFILGMKRNTKFMSVYPNMLTLGYFMIKGNANFKTTTWWGATLEIDSNTIVNYLLDGGFEQPWYLFAGENTRLNKSELILAYDYALRLGAFEVFGQAKDLNGNKKIDRLQFFEALKGTMDEQIGKLKSIIENIKKTSENSDAQEILKRCANNFENATQDIKLDLFEKYALFGDFSSGQMAAAASFYNSSSEYFSTPKTQMTQSSSLRNDLNNRHLQLKAMSLPLIENIKNMDGSQEEKNALLKKINDSLDSVNSLLKNYYGSALKNHHQIDSCTQKLVIEEKNRRFFLIEKEKEFYGKIYDDLLNLSKASPENKNQMISNFSQKWNVSSANFNAGNYTFSKYELFKRFENYSKDPILKIKLNVEEPDSSSADLLKSISKTIFFYNSETGKPVSKDAFIRNGLSKLSSQGNDLVQWFRNDNLIRLNQIKIESMIAIYRLGYDLGLQTTAINFEDRKLNPITAKNLIEEGLKLTEVIQIRPQQANMMNLMGEYEFVPTSSLNNLLFNSSETEFYGILDSIYMGATRSSDDLSEAERYYKERLNTRNSKIDNSNSVSSSIMIFPMEENIEQGIHKIYKRLIDKDQSLIRDFDQAISQYEKTLSPEKLSFTYKLSPNQGQFVYSPTKISTAGSLLVDQRKITGNSNLLKDFHTRITNGHYLKP